MKILTRADEILLLAILRLKDNAYGTSILKEIKVRTGKELSFGSLWVSLDSLARRGLINKRTAKETHPHGGRKKIFYRLTSSGILELQSTQKLNRRLWGGASSRLKNYE